MAGGAAAQAPALCWSTTPHVGHDGPGASGGSFVSSNTEDGQDTVEGQGAGRGSLGIASHVTCSTRNETAVTAASAAHDGAAAEASQSVAAVESFASPDAWRTEFRRLQASTIEAIDHVALVQNGTATLSRLGASRVACCVRAMPELERLKASLRRRARAQRRQPYEMWDDAGALLPQRGSCALTPRPARSAASRAGTAVTTTATHGLAADYSQVFLPPPAIWTVSGAADGAIHVYNTVTGRRAMSIFEPKLSVPVTTLLHAPFRGLMTRKLRVLPIAQPQDLLRLNTRHLIYTDYVWVGFADGAVRLFPANPSYVQDSDRGAQLMKGELADMVFELPKYHTAGVIAFARSPCHQDTAGAEVSTANRLTTAVQYMTAATRHATTGAVGDDIDAGNGDDDAVAEVSDREHLSLLCTASVDSSVVVWDVKKIYRAIEGLRAARREAMAAATAGGRAPPVAASSLSSAATGGAYAKEVVTIEGYDARGRTEFSFRSSCQLVNVRPLMRLKGSVAALKTLHWVSTLVSSREYRPGRDVAALTRAAEEAQAPDVVKERQAVQRLTAAERREQHRQQLHISLEDMHEIEEELEQLMPHLRQEPAQSLRINLLVASDNIGTVHLWNLDEELRKSTLTPAQVHVAARTGRSSATPSRSPQRPNSRSPGRASSGVATGTAASRPRQTTSPSVQLSAVDAVRGSRSSVAAAAAARTKRLAHTSSNYGVVSRVPGEASHGAASATKRATPHVTRPASSPSPGRGSVGAPHGTTRETRMSVGTTLSLAAVPTQPAAAGRGSAAHTTSPSPAARPEKGVRRSEPALVAAPTVPLLSKMQMLVLERQQGRLTTRQGAGQAVVSGSAASHDGGRLVASPSPQTSRAYSRGGGSPSMTRSTRRSPAALSRPRTETSTAGHGKPRKVAARGKAARATNAAADAKVAASTKPTRAASPATMGAGGAKPRGNRGTTPTPARRSEAAAVPPRAMPVTHRARPVLAAQSERQRVNDFLSRSANCRIEFTGGVAVTGMAIDLPPVLHCTLRRVVGKVARNVSLLDEPTAAEIEERVLQNSFDPLSEPRALYLVFQRLQLYVSVEGAVLNLRCVPHWQCADDDGRELFMHTQEAMYETRKEYQLSAGEVVIAGRVQMPGFDVELRKRLVEVHSQPVTQLLLQPRVGQLWVARNDGIMTIFDTETRRVLTRIPHPCATAALGPPNELEWRRQQRALVQESALLLGAPGEGGTGAAGRSASAAGAETTTAASSGVRLEWHRETQGYPASHFTYFVPFRTRTQVMLALRSNRAVRSGDGVVAGAGGRPVTATPLSAAVSASEAELPCLTADARWPSDPATVTLVQKADGRSDMSVHAQCLERHLSQLLGKLFVCRAKADAVRVAQMGSYEALCARIADNVAVVMRQLDTYTSLPHLRRCYEMWRQHARHTPHAHVLRRLHRDRVRELQGVASRLANAAARRLCALYFARWLQCRAARNVEHQRRCVARLLRGVVTPSTTLPSTGMMVALWRRRTRTGYFAAWRAFATRRAGARRRVEVTSYALSTAVDVNRMDQRGAMKAVAETQPCSSSSVTNGATASCRTTGSGLLVSYGEYSGSSNGGVIAAAAGRRETSDALARPASADTVTTQPSDEEDRAAAMADAPACLPAFLAAVVDIYKARAHILRASDTAPSAKSIIDDSWLSIVESAEANAGPSASREQLKLCVFQYGFLPLLQGMLVTADDVLPNLYDTSVVTEVRSMFGGILLCMDYVMADAEVVLAHVLTAPPVLTEVPPPALDKTQPPTRAPRAGVDALDGRRDGNGDGYGVAHARLLSDAQEDATSTVAMLPLLTPDLLCRRVMAHLATIAAADEDCLQAMEDIVRDVDSLEAFMTIVAAPKVTE